MQCDDSWKFDIKHRTKECALVFGNFSLPIIKITERNMLEFIRRWEL